jgi:hypothetical protein
LNATRRMQPEYLALAIYIKLDAALKQIVSCYEKKENGQLPSDGSPANANNTQRAEGEAEAFTPF